MTRFFVFALLSCTACAPTLRAQPISDAPGLAFTNVNVVDVESGRVMPDQTVLVTGNRITTVAPAAEVRVPRDAQVVDGSGKYLIPGLWDMHSHVTGFGPTSLKLYLANGVTGVRDMGAERFAVAKAWRDSIAAGLLLGPRMKIASPVVENPRWLAWVKSIEEKAGLPWTLYERFGPGTPEQAVRWVDSVAALGPDHIKVRNWPDTATGRALVARARERGIPVVAHGNEPFPRTGITSYEHGVSSTQKASEAVRNSLWRQIAGSGAAFVPTLVTWPIRLETPDTLLAKLSSGRIAGLRYVPEKTVQKWRDQFIGLKQERPQNWTEIYRANLRDVAEVRREGIPLMAGTDIGAPLLVPGFSLHDELALLVSAAGLTSAEALQAATLTPARVMGVADSLGTVAVGKLADLVLLEANPLEDIRNTRRIHTVVANGRLLDRTALDRLLAEAEAAAR